MKFCPQCGEKNQGDARYCTHCGGAFPSDSFSRTEDSSFDSACDYNAPSPPLTKGETSETRSFVPDAENPPPSEARSGALSERVLIENSTPFTKENLKELNKPQKRISIGCFIVGGVFLLLYIVVGVFRWLPELFEVRKGVFIISFVLLFLGLVNFLIGKSVVNNNKIFTNSTYYLYRFYDESFQVFLFDGTRKISEANFFYPMITRTEERKRQLRIFLGNMFYCIDCSEFLRGSEAELKELLTRKSMPGAVKFKTF